VHLLRLQEGVNSALLAGPGQLPPTKWVLAHTAKILKSFTAEELAGSSWWEPFVSKFCAAFGYQYATLNSLSIRDLYLLALESKKPA
jgi:hypothetical protein